MKRLTIMMKAVLIMSFPLLFLSCGGTSLNEADDHGDMMEENEGVMEEGVLGDTINHEMEEGDMMEEEGF